MRTIARDKPKEWNEVVGWAVEGGVEIPVASGDGAVIIANAAVIVSLDDGAG